MYGDQSKASHLRVLTCLELIEHGDYYKKQHKSTGIPLVSPDFKESVLSCAMVKGIIRWHHGLKNSKLVQLFGNPKQKTRKMNFLKNS